MHLPKREPVIVPRGKVAYVQRNPRKPGNLSGSAFGEKLLRAQYLVGCDGGRSVIRKAAGIEFRGWGPTRSNLIAEVEMVFTHSPNPITAVPWAYSYRKRNSQARASRR